MPANKATRKYDLPRFKFGFPQLPSRRPGKAKVKAATTPGRIISERGDGPRPSRETLALELSFKFSIGATKAIALETSSCLGGFYAEPGVLRLSRATRAIHYVVLGGRRNRAGRHASDPLSTPRSTVHSRPMSKSSVSHCKFPGNREKSREFICSPTAQRQL